MFDLLNEVVLMEKEARIYIAEIVLALEHLHKVGTVLHWYMILSLSSGLHNKAM
jgi:hypothetical protein